MTIIDRLRELEQAATPGPWRWGGDVDHRSVYLSTVDRGRIYVMRFVRWGMHSAQPRFQGPDGLGMVDAADHVVREQPYRGDIARLNHPDAAIIAEARNALPSLLAVAEAAREHLRQTCTAEGDCGRTWCADLHTALARLEAPE